MNNKHIKIAEQETVLNEKKSQIVSASAGSGKTTIMIQKVLKLLLEQECHINELLVLTYTKSAATEMKKKLVEKLKENIAEYDFLQEELDLVQSADISTFDSFCQKLVKKYFYVINVDPAFGVLDSGKQAYLQGLALDSALNELKTNCPQDYENLLANFSPARNEQNIKTLVLEVYNFLTSVFDENGFWTTTLNLYDHKTKIAENELNAHYNQKFLQIKTALETLLINAKNLGFLSYVEYINALCSHLDALVLLNNFGEKVDYINALSIKALYAIKADEIAFKDKIAEHKNSFSKLCDEIKKEYISAQNIQNSYKNCQILIKNLQNLVNIFKIKYQNQKTELNTFDFNDIERMSIILLQNAQINAEVKGGYKNIFVDEFQDANRVQEKIINLLDNNNLFFVGDTKQSIYAFRQSEPDIFLNIEKQFKNSPNASANTLNSNFRTNKNILEFANQIFNVIMTEGTCGINYKQNAQFVAKAEYADLKNETCVSLNLILNNAQDEQKLEMDKVYSVKQNANSATLFSAYDYESAFICQKIAELLGQEIFDKNIGKTKKINFSDITILLSKRGSFLKTLLKHLSDVGIPYVVNVNNNLEDCYDNLVMYNLLKLVFNSQDDYALYSVLSSALFNFDDTALAYIRQNSDNKYFYECLKSYSYKDDNLAKKVNDFYNTLNDFAFDVKYKGIYFALNNIIKNTNYLLNIQSQNEFAERKLNLLAYINSFAGSSFDNNLCDYIMYRETSAKKEKVVSDKSFVQAVEITTMHSSKGLEYPVVILPFLSQDYTKEPTHSEIKINKDLGIGIKNYDLDERSISGGIFYNACKIKNKKIDISEKIRLLYVAMTRAKNKLIITGTAGKNYKQISSDANVLSANNYLSLVVGCLNDEVIDNINAGNEFECNLFNNQKIKLSVQNVQIDNEVKQDNIIAKKSDQSVVDKVSEFLNIDLTKQASSVALKNSVSEFAFDDEANLTFAPNNFTLSEHMSQKASDVGTLYHKLLQMCNFSEINKIDDIKLFVECNFDAEQVKIFEQIGYDKIFNNIANIKNLISGDSQLLKEQKFVMRVKHNQVVDGGEDVNILVQGIIDLLAISKTKVLLIDYKHSKKTDEQIKQTYKKQLDLYALALSKRFKGVKIEKIIINLHKNSLIYM